MKRKTIERIPIASLDLSVVTPCRANLREDTVARYAELLQEDTTGWPFATHIIVARVKGDGKAYVVDGRHRIEASLRTGKACVICSTYEAADLDEVIREARCANAKHGERLTRDELRENLLAFFRAGGDRQSDTDVGMAFGINRRTVAKIRAELNVPTRKEAVTAAVERAIEEHPEAGVRELAKASGVSVKTVRGATEIVSDGVCPNGQKCQKGTPTPPPVTPPLPRREIAAKSENLPPQMIRALKEHLSHPTMGKSAAPLPKPPTDVLGHEIPPDLYEAWEGERKTVGDWLNRVRSVLREVKAGMGGDTEGGLHSLRYNLFAMSIVTHLECAVSALKDVRPEALCTCQGLGCRRCGMRGWMTERQYQLNIPDDEK